MSEGAGDVWSDACLAARLLAIDPAGLGGAWLRARIGPARDRWLDLLRGAMPPGRPLVRLPLNTGDDRLLGGLDLTATLAAGRPVAERGLLAAADGGLLLVVMAERCTAGSAARIAAALDTAEVAAERDGFALRHPTRFGIVALDEGAEPDEQPPLALTERLALRIDLTDVPPREAAPPEAGDLEAARALLPQVAVPDASIDALAGAAFAFGIDSLRTPIQAIRVARAAAALAGRVEVEAEDVAAAARLVLAPRATRLPPSQEGEPEPAEAEPPPLPEDRGEDEDDAIRHDATEDDSADRQQSEPSMDDVVQAAVAAAIPAGLLESLRLGQGGRGGRQGSGSGAQQRDRRRGRPAGTVRGEPTRGARLNVVETLRAAAPWQTIRRVAGSEGRLAIRRDDLRITRFKRRIETTTIFVVDASGSSAFHRLAEAKGAVELLLAECYIRRDRVALMAFRGTAAELILPPTRSLARAKRSLAALPGGGGTPLATAIDAAGALAGSVTRQGGSAVLVFMTDGRANIARDGRAAREPAGLDARAAARAIRETGASALFIDISLRPYEIAAAIARDMGAGYLPLPSADAATLSGLVRREVAAAAGRATR